MNSEYIEEINIFNMELKYYNQELINLDNSYYDICNSLSLIDTEKYDGNKIKVNNLFKYFINVIDELKDDSKEFYINKKNNIKIIRTSSFENGYAEIVENSKKNNIYLTKNHLKDIDLVAFTHELGHIPTITNGSRLDYFEYSEVLPIFFEFLTWISLDKENAKEMFIKTRLDIAKSEATNLLGIYESMYGNNSLHDISIENKIRECYKYILSFEYVLNLIEIYSKDKNYVYKMIDDIICGFSSFKNIEKEINIDIEKCNKIKNLVYQNISK